MRSPGTEVLVCLQRQADDRGWVLDASQRAAIIRLQRIHDGLLGADSFRRIGLLRRAIKPNRPSGLYLWGGVGRGKTFVMDAFFSCVPLKHKRRMHFHHFMQEVHARLAAMAGQTDPLARLAREFSQHVRLLCLDEFHIHDIADAMLIRGLLQGLLDGGVVLVVTSNAEPDALYRNGLQRAQFLPGIAIIKARLDVVCLDGGVDYRLAARQQGGGYHAPLNENAEQALAAIFRELAGGEGEKNTGLQVEGRTIIARQVGHGIAWFEFGALCDSPRSKADYIDLARCFHTLLLSGVPQFDRQTLASARRFLWLVDELYDSRIRLVVSAAVPLPQLASPALFGGEFERVLSRLAEMQSREYLAQTHQSD